MRTTLDLDDKAVADAMKLHPDKSKTEVINEALREMARRRRLQELAKEFGKHPWEGNLDELRGRTRRR